MTQILKSSFLKDSVIYGLTGALSKFAVFLTIPVYTRYLNLEDFGVLDLYLTIGALIYIFLEMQMQTGFMRSYYEKKREEKLEKLLGTLLGFYIIGYIVLLLLLCMLFIFDIHSKYLIYRYLLPIVLTILPKQLFDLNNIILRMEHKTKQYLFFNISSVFLIAIFGITTVVYIEASIELIMWAIFYGNFILAVVAFYNIQKGIQIRLNFVYIEEVFYYSAPIVPAVLGGWAMSAIGKIYISEYLPLGNLGIYSLALKIGMIFLLFVQAFRMSWQPFMIKKFADKDATKVFAKALNYYMVFGLIAICAIYIISPLIIKILAPKEYVIDNNLILILLFSYFWQGSINIISSGNSWVRKTYYNSIGSIIGSIVVVIVIYYLIQKIGLRGAAIGQLVGFISNFFITMYFAQRNIKIEYKTFNIVIVFFINFGVLLIC